MYSKVLIAEDDRIQQMIYKKIFPTATVVEDGLKALKSFKIHLTIF